MEYCIYSNCCCGSGTQLCILGDLGFIPGSGRSLPWRREWQPPPVFFPGKFLRQRSLAGYSPWCHKGSDTTEWLTLSHFSWRDGKSTLGSSSLWPVLVTWIQHLCSIHLVLPLLCPQAGLHLEAFRIKFRENLRSHVKVPGLNHVLELKAELYNFLLSYSMYFLSHFK